MNKISVIVPVYNVEDYLQECIDSILGQTYKNLEIILVDDGSTDNSSKICDIYEKKDNRIKVIHKENGGVSSSRNEGLKHVTGDYIGFVDSDDFIDNRMYEKLYNKIKEYDADIIKCNFVSVKEGHMLETKSTGKSKLYNREEAMLNYMKEPYKYNKHFKVVLWDALYKKELFDNVEFPNGLLYEDGYVTPKVILKSRRLVHLDESLYYYRTNNQGIMSKGITQESLKSLDDWKEIHLLVKNKIPSCSSISAEKWLRKYITIYNILLDRKDLDSDGYYKNYIVEQLKYYNTYFKSFNIINKPLIRSLNIINFNPNIYRCFIKIGLLKI